MLHLRVSIGIATKRRDLRTSPRKRLRAERLQKDQQPRQVLAFYPLRDSNVPYHLPLNVERVEPVLRGSSNFSRGVEEESSIKHPNFSSLPTIALLNLGDRNLHPTILWSRRSQRVD